MKEFFEVNNSTTDPPKNTTTAKPTSKPTTKPTTNPPKNTTTAAPPTTTVSPWNKDFTVKLSLAKVKMDAFRANGTAPDAYQVSFG